MTNGLYLGAALVLALGCLVGMAQAGQPTAEPLWPDGAPLATGEADRDKPSLTTWLAPKDKANGAAVVICPGGGYGGLAVGHEGRDVAAWLNS
ncbi:alpha/beta hydrolase, partial [bacterium]|nr:alpha/beta hydrolase [bacterium]